MATTYVLPERHLEPVVYAIGPIRGRDRQGQFDHLLLVEVLPERVEVGLLHVARIGAQQVGVA